MSYSTQTKTHFSFVPADMPHGYLKPLCKTPGPRSTRSQPVSPGPAGPPPESEHFMAAPHSLFTMSFPIWGWPTPVWHVFILLCVYAQSGPTFCDPVNLSLPGSSFHGIFQTSILQWVVISYSSIYIYARSEGIYFEFWQNNSKFLCLEDCLLSKYVIKLIIHVEKW